MIDIVFVVLHYLTIDDTIECVNSIKEKCKKGNFRIVIVDNASPNNSKNELKEVYENDNIKNYYPEIEEEPKVKKQSLFNK